ncbi:hypothetical protein Tco_1157750 [Tanacetum coccineum]
MAGLPPRAQRYLWLRYEVKGYTKEIVQDYEQRLATIFSKQVNRVHILDFEGLTEEMRQGLTDRLRMIYTRAEGQVLFTRHAWRRLFEIWRPLVREFMLEFFSTCSISDTEMGLDIADTLLFQLDGDFLGVAPSYTLIRDPLRRLCHRLLPLNISVRAQEPKKVTATNLFYLRSMDEGTVNVPYLLRLAEYFGLVSDEGHIGLTVIARELSVIDMDELVRLRICDRLDDTRAWVAPSLERQQVAAARAPEGVEGAPFVDEEDNEARKGGPWTERESLDEQREVIDAMARDFSRFTVWAASDISQVLDLSGATYMRYSETHVPYQRRMVRQRTDGVSTSTP